MTHWVTVNSGWVYEVFPLDIMTMEDSNLGLAIELWQSKRPGDGLPAWRDFDLQDFADRYGWFTVYDIIPGAEFDMRCRLWGTKLVDLHGMDITGKCVFSRENGLFGDTLMFDQMDMDFYSNLITERMVGLCGGSIEWQQRDHVRYKAVMMPLADDHQNIDKFLVSASVVE